MASKVEKKENNIVDLQITYSVEEFKAGMNFAYKKNAKRFNVPGFRPGKAPMAVALRYYGEGALYDDAIDYTISQSYRDTIAEHGLEPVAQPELSVHSVGLDKGLDITLTLTVKPEVVLGQYKGVEAVMPESEVKDADVEAELERIRERNARMVSVDERPIADGDIANIDYEGFLNGEPFAGGKGEQHDLRIGSKSFIPGFEEQLIGKRAGEELELNLTFPEDYHAEELKGKDVVFKVKINGVKVKELPELDDEFAKDVSEFETLEEYKRSIRSEQEERAAQNAKQRFENNAIDAATDLASVDIPAVMIEGELDQMVRQQDAQMRQQGFSLEQYLGFMGQDLAGFREQGRSVAERRVKTTLVLEAIARAEAFTVSEEEIEAELQSMAERYKMSLEDLKKSFSEEGYDFIKEKLTNQKAIDLITSTALPVAPPPVMEVAEKDAAEAE